MKRVASIRVTAFLLMAACAALCQSPPSTELFLGLQSAASDSTDAPRHEMRPWNSLPDAPSPVGSPRPDERFHALADEVRSPLTLDAFGRGAAVMPEAEQGYLALGARPSSISFSSAPSQKENDPGAFWNKHLHLPQVQPPLSTSGSFARRTFAAASGFLITHEDSGKGRLNTSYILVALSAAAAHAAYRPYWARSASATFDDFGSSMGSDAGINVFHEFEPGIRQVVRDHIPRFMFRIEDRVFHGHSPRDAISPAR